MLDCQALAMHESIYDDLRQLARKRLAELPAGQTLQPTALVHEVYLKLGPGADQARDRSHFYAMAARAMRFVLVEEARKKGRLKRGGGLRRVTIAGIEGEPDAIVDVLAVDEALQKLESLDPSKSKIVELRFFAGFSHQETAQALELSVDAVKREWRFIRRWLSVELRGDTDGRPGL